MTNYKDSTEYAYRRLVRAAIRKSNMTKSDRDITLAIVNLWFHHRNGPKGYIHPGRKHLAKKANVSIITVARCLTRLRDSHVILAIKNPKGEGQKPTQYVVNIHALMLHCGQYWLDEFMALSSPKCYTTFPENDTPLAYQNDTQYKYTSNVLLFENNLAKKSNGGKHE
jgi:hypothetical protein